MRCWWQRRKRLPLSSSQSFLLWPPGSLHSLKPMLQQCVGCRVDVEGQQPFSKVSSPINSPVFPLLTTLPLQNCASLPWPMPRWGFMNCCLIWQSRPPLLLPLRILYCQCWSTMTINRGGVRTTQHSHKDSWLLIPKTGKSTLAFFCEMLNLKGFGWWVGENEHGCLLFHNFFF